ncbi:uncharacterized protein LOC130703836 [Daphnia carinata]|uniref:uncharacterized protein LOC130703836 n=1 Tax=Daphnia carinata TaxID=120202 RepID=UPI002579F109|nr:uncharacterized protein LOC130703836 [Daphnia carinata]
MAAKKKQKKVKAPVTSAVEKKTSEPEKVESETWKRIKTIVHNHVVPPLFLVFFTPIVQVLAFKAIPDIPFEWDRVLGNVYSWKVVIIFLSWALMFLLISDRTFKGPPTSVGYVPVYADNGLFYYATTFITYLGLHIVYPNLSRDIYDNMPYILGSLNIVALALCLILLIMGKWRPQTSERMPSAPILLEFYRGMEIHPRLFGVDVKQWTNCRVGMMAWQILIVAFLIAGGRNNINPGHLANVVIQTFYITKFFYWETGYFNTLDITLDRAGYYICWGCLVWVPGFYTYSSFYLVAHPSMLSEQAAFLVAVLGLFIVSVNYRIDYEKQLFRATNGNCLLWGKPAKAMAVRNQIANRPSTLLLSGFWGVGRHLNYTFEIIAAFLWCFPGYGLGIWPFLYFFFLIGLLVHRCYRDEEKCSAKYGHFWKDYCKRVPYRMIPYVF